MINETNDSLFKKSPDFVARKIAGEIVLIPLQRHLENVNSIYSLNEMGAVVWDAIDGKKKVSDIREELLGVFDVSPQTINTDLEVLLSQLVEIKAISSE
ncbi:MAG: PqqD family protein [Candidatus Omnitrophica bacterium]|nr:PqqD family protein [Candidatus Omnitrophota bacterium]